jgi:hypothetical protein
MREGKQEITLSSSQKAVKGRSLRMRKSNLMPMVEWSNLRSMKTKTLKLMRGGFEWPQIC